MARDVAGNWLVRNYLAALRGHIAELIGPELQYSVACPVARTSLLCIGRGPGAHAAFPSWLSRAQRMGNALGKGNKRVGEQAGVGEETRPRLTELDL